MRFARLIVGLVLFGLGVACMARAELGLGPWAALNDGVSRHVGLPLGTVDMLMSIPILLLWLPLRQRPGPGTILSAFVLGGSTNVGLVLIPPVEAPVSPDRTAHGGDQPGGGRLRPVPLD